MRRLSKKLGEDVRADYSASLLNLATDNAIMFGMPLAFGEVDTKGRIKNLAAWKKPTFWVTIGAILICIVGIVICISNPKEKICMHRNLLATATGWQKL